MSDLVNHFPDWHRDALCAEVDAELWFPEKGSSPRAAQRICCRCDVQQECLEAALELAEQGQPPSGVWGGTTEQWRRELIRERRAATRERAAA